MSTLKYRMKQKPEQGQEEVILHPETEANIVTYDGTNQDVTGEATDVQGAIEALDSEKQNKVEILRFI